MSIPKKVVKGASAPKRQLPPQQLPAQPMGQPQMKKGGTMKKKGGRC